MMRSLYSGVAGLKTHQTKMDVLGNNIANVNTTSFKSQSITFSDLMYQTTQTASGATETKGGVNARQIGLGAKSGAINTAIESQGATQTTNNPFDIMITGKAFFVVNNGSEQLYTRDGSFYVDGAGNLAMQSNGYFVMGWNAKEDKETGVISIDKNGELSQLQIMSAANYTYSPASTTAALFSGNIDAKDSNVLSDDGKTITLEFYDNKGYLYTGKFTLKDTATDHQYVLSLTEVIDSKGNKLTDAQMKQITLGDKETDHSTAIDSPAGYTFVPSADSKTISVNAPNGDVKYANVQNDSSDYKYSLSDIKSTSNKKYKGVLNNVYGVTTADEAKYDDDALYKVDTTTGELSIKYNEKIVSGEKYNTNAGTGNNFSFVNNKVEGKTYFVNDAMEAFLVPDSSGEVKNLTSEYLERLYGIPHTGKDFDFANAKDYTYYYNDDRSLDIKKTITIKAATKAKYSDLAADTDKVAQLANFVSEPESAASSKLTDDIAAWLAGTGHDVANLKYSYASNEITLWAQEYEATDYAASTNADPTSLSGATFDYTGLLAKLPDLANGLTYTDLTAYINTATQASADKQAEIDALNPADPNYASDQAALQDEKDAIDKLLATAEEVKNIVDNKIDASFYASADQVVKDALTDLDAYRNKTKIVINDIAGTDGMVISYSDKALGALKALPKTYVNKTVDHGDLDSAFTPLSSNSAAYVFKSTSENPYAKAYSLGSSTTGTFNKGNYATTYQTLLEDVFSSNDTVMTELAKIKTGQEYSISFDQTDGKLTISYSKEVTGLKMSDEYKIKDNGDGTISYTSTSVYSDVVKEGNIADLMEASKSNTAGLLKKLYGISDAEADAYGTDGTYRISDDGKITLTLGVHSVNLVFNAANGALVTADGAKDGMVTLNFNQKEKGLEAFGYQAGTGEEDKAGNVTIDFSTLTNYNTNGASTIKANKGDISSLNTGRAVGEMNGVSVSTDGQIYATYSNGQTKLLGQIASAEFANASGLSKQGDNLYSSTLNSGEATIQDITTDGGYMNTGVLEMSNVDLSREFTEMITTQRGFQANSRIITVSDTLLEELTNLKR